MVTDDQQEETVSKKMYFLLMDEYFLLTYFLIGTGRMFAFKGRFGALLISS